MKHLKLLSPDEASASGSGTVTPTSTSDWYCSTDGGVKLCARILRFNDTDYTIEVEITTATYSALSLAAEDVVILPEKGEEIIRVRQIIATLSGTSTAGEVTLSDKISISSTELEEIITVTTEPSNTAAMLPKKPKSILNRLAGDQ